MSRNKKDARGGHNPRPSGWEYWSRRPGYCGAVPGRDAKQRTHRLERLADDKLCRSELADLSEYKETLRDAQAAIAERHMAPASVIRQGV